jgi:hypothetical protein
MIVEVVERNGKPGIGTIRGYFPIADQPPRILPKLTAAGFLSLEGRPELANSTGFRVDLPRVGQAFILLIAVIRGQAPNQRHGLWRAR